MTNDPLLKPYTLKNLTLPNRLVSTSHAAAYAIDGMPQERYLRYHLEKAKGGVGLTMMGGASCVSPESPAFVNNIALYRDEVVGHLKRLTDAVHEYDTKVMIQVTHAGRRTSNYAGDWFPIVSASGRREPQHKAFPKIAEDWDMERIVHAFADAAERCKDGGLDGIELLGVGHLLDAFWSPATNDRADHWGGSFENRLRFPLEVMEAVRKRVGEDFVVGARIAVDEDLDNGLNTHEGIEVVNRLTDAGLDFVSVVKGGYDSDARLASVIPPMGTPQHPQLEFCKKVKDNVSIPVMHACRIRNLGVAREAIQQGQMDLVGMVRPFIADPYLVQKIRDGQEDRIRPAVGTGFGIDRIYAGGDMVDVGNPSTGREATLPHHVAEAKQRKKAVVVGAGIAGLEAARTLAERGHEVKVFEAQRQAGGQVRLISNHPRRNEIIGLIEWRVSELKHLGVTVQYNSHAVAEMIRKESPDVVVIATGGIPQVGDVEAAEGLLTSPWDVIGKGLDLQGDVLVFDDNGAESGLDITEVVTETATSVEYVTPERSAGVMVGSTAYPQYLRKFAEENVTITPTYRLLSVHRTEGDRLVAELKHEFADLCTTRVVDHVIVEHGTKPVDELYFQLKPLSVNGGAVNQQELVDLEPQSIIRNPNGEFQLFRIGDAVCSRNIAAATLDAYRLCYAI